MIVGRIRRLRRKLRDARPGVSLIELIAIAIILGVLALILVPNVVSALGLAKTNALKTQLAAIQTASDDFYAQVGQYPAYCQPSSAEPGCELNWAAADPFVPDFLRTIPSANPAAYGLNPANGATVYWGVDPTGQVFATQVPPGISNPAGWSPLPTPRYEQTVTVTAPPGYGTGSNGALVVSSSGITINGQPYADSTLGGTWNFTTVDIEAGATLTETPGEPLVIKATQGVTIDGTLDGNAVASAAAQPVGDGGAGGSTPQGCGSYGGGGGGGGGAAGAGQAGPLGLEVEGSPCGTGAVGGIAGGAGGAATSSGTTPAFGALGGSGGSIQGTSVAGGAGGWGGGDIVIQAAFINVAGSIQADGGAGAPGVSADNATSGPGGGGGGGTIALTAPTITLSSPSDLAANGGPGGGSKDGTGGAGLIALAYNTLNGTAPANAVVTTPLP